MLRWLLGILARIDAALEKEVERVESSCIGGCDCEETCCDPDHPRPVVHCGVEANGCNEPRGSSTTSF